MNTSILIDVIGPVMRGPSSSHTAASFHLSALARSLLGEEPAWAEFVFDNDGSYAQCYRTQGSDLAFTVGLLGWPITDERFSQALELAPSLGLQVGFRVDRLPKPDHPNAVQIRLRGRNGARLHITGRSIGGGAVEITAIEGWPVLLNGSGHILLIEADAGAEAAVCAAVAFSGSALRDRNLVLVVQEQACEATRQQVGAIQSIPGVQRIWQARPLSFVKRQAALWNSAQAMIATAEAEGLSLGETAARYEAHLLGLSLTEVIAEMARRVEIMLTAVRQGLAGESGQMQLLQPTAASIYRAEANGQLAVGGLHTRAAARAMAAMHVNCGMGVVCAAPTAGSAGVLPGVLTTLIEECGVSLEKAALCLLAAGAIGVVVAERATFAAEVAGCQVEIGAAGAMAAGAVVEYTAGSARQAADAAAICFQNTMGMVCDLVQGIVEIPCHTRNAVAASSAFVCADLVLGGYDNPVPLDETVDAVYAVGQMMPREAARDLPGRFGGGSLRPRPGPAEMTARPGEKLMSQAKLRFLSKDDIRCALPMSEAMQVMKDVFAAVSRGQVVMPLRQHLEIPQHEGIVLFMPSFLPQQDCVGLKTITLFDRNPAAGLPRIQALVLLFDGSDGRPLAVLEGTYLTALRTGAACGAATDLLARPNASRVALLAQVSRPAPSWKQSERCGPSERL